MSYHDMLKTLGRLEAEAGCELPELSDPTPRERALRLLRCDDPPRGEDRDFCLGLLGGDVAAG
jgi:hypothetical protein